MTSTIPFYVYRVLCLPTREFYFGYRTTHVKHNREPEQDLWYRYFTSSNKVKQLIQQYGGDQFETSIIFKTFDLDECFWHEQEVIKQHIHDPLCINHYYHDSSKGHRQFRASSATCTYCHKLIGSGNIHKHELSCVQNPNRSPPIRPKSPCQFCNRMCGPGMVGRHEIQCDLNPNKTKAYGKPFEEKTNCKFCHTPFKSVALGKHERRCSANPNLKSDTVLCPHCEQFVLKNQVNTVHRKSCSGAVYDVTTKKYKVKCTYCSEWIGAAAINKHQRRCLQNPNKIVHTVKKVNCRYCDGLFGLAGCIVTHERSCSLNPAYVAPDTKALCEMCNKRVSKYYLPTHQSICKSNKFTCTPV
jgi:hypothetical protein